eukprot:TRINITY_DN13436_c0_g1_i4.p2 TRINITY_DN13436_c0_g1~~TRINITY_DN13436_c0_g1_i4.p2  ORF type:complete len:192 (+),score=32.66 TRINITY_DN13436_c0_g1_i4:62-637(+)
MQRGRGCGALAARATAPHTASVLPPVDPRGTGEVLRWSALPRKSAGRTCSCWSARGLDEHAEVAAVKRYLRAQHLSPDPAIAGLTDVAPVADVLLSQTTRDGSIWCVVEAVGSSAEQLPRLVLFRFAGDHEGEAASDSGWTWQSCTPAPDTDDPQADRHAAEKELPPRPRSVRRRLVVAEHRVPRHSLQSF